MGWLEGYDDTAAAAIRVQQLRESMMLRAALDSIRASEEVVPPPASARRERNPEK
jgi:hypothetical protein